MPEGDSRNQRSQNGGMGQQRLQPRPSHTGLVHSLRRKFFRSGSVWTWLKWISILGLILYLIDVLALLIWSRGEQQLVILLWNDELPARPITQSLFEYNECGCIITTERHLLGGEFDAIIFNGDKPYTTDGLEKVHRTDFYYAVYAAKRPFNELGQPIKHNGIAPYNLTMTYRNDSDVVWREYFVAHRRRPHEMVKQFAEPDLFFMDHICWKQARQLRKIFYEKSDFIAYTIFDVNDETHKKSELLSDIRKLVDLSAFPSCTNNDYCDSYKFLLIVETTNCADYISPDFFVALSKFIVPVVFGNAEYYRYAPPKSYIDARDFASPRDLIRYLDYLDKDTKMYREYFWWHVRYFVNYNTKQYCGLCHALQRSEEVKRYFSDGLDFTNWFDKSNCQGRGFEFKSNSTSNITKA